MQLNFPGRGFRRVLVTVVSASLAFLATARASGPGPVRLVLLVDTSRSITAQDLAEVRALAVDLLRHLPPGSVTKAYSFDDRSVLVAQTADPDVLETALGGLAARGNHTLLYDAIYDRARELQKQPSTAAAVIVVATDGRDAGSASQADDAARAAQAAKVPVFALGIGKVSNRPLRRIAKLTDGGYFPIGESSGESLALRIAHRVGAESADDTAPPQKPSTREPGPDTSRPTQPDAPSTWGIPGLAWWALGGGLLIVAAIVAAVRLGRRPPSPAPQPLPTAGEAPLPGAAGPSAQALPAVANPTFDATLVSAAGSAPVVVNRTQLIELSDGTLAIQEGTGVGQVFKVSRKADTVIGRGQLADVQLTDPTISQEHCRIASRRGYFHLQDLESTNGTFVNGERITEHVLRNGDVVRIGETVLEFQGAL